MLPWFHLQWHQKCSVIIMCWCCVRIVEAAPRAHRCPSLQGMGHNHVLWSTGLGRCLLAFSGGLLRKLGAASTFICTRCYNSLVYIPSQWAFMHCPLWRCLQMTFCFCFFVYGRYTSVPCHVLGKVLALFHVTVWLYILTHDGAWLTAVFSSLLCGCAALTLCS